MTSITRRTVITGLAGASLLPAAAVAADKLVVGFVYVGPRDDLGYNHSHAIAARKLQGLPGVTLVEQERVPESEAATRAMEAMIVQNNASLVYATSWGYYDPYVLALARQYPKVVFRHCGGAWQQGDPLNVGSYWGHMHEGQFVAGFVAAKVAASDKLGFIVAKRIPSNLRNLNAFTLGAQAARQSATVQTVFTGSWSDPVREAEAVNALADHRVAAIGCSVDSCRTVAENAQRRGIYFTGYNASVEALSPDSYLTAVIPDWAAININTTKMVMAGQLPPNRFSGGLAEGLVKMDRIGASVSDEAASMMNELLDQIKSGKRQIWQGPIYDNQNVMQVDYDEVLERSDLRLRDMNWFVRGVSA